MYNYDYEIIAEEDVENIRDDHTFKLQVYLIPWLKEYRFRFEDITDIDLDVHDFLDIPVKDKAAGLAEIEKWRDYFTLSKHAFAMKRAAKMVDSKQGFKFYAQYTDDGYTRRTVYDCKVLDDGDYYVERKYNRDYQVSGEWSDDGCMVLTPGQLKDYIAKLYTDGYSVGKIEED